MGVLCEIKFNTFIGPMKVPVSAIGVHFTVLYSSDVIVYSWNPSPLSNSLPDCTDCPGGSCGIRHILAAPSRCPPLG